MFATSALNCWFKTRRGHTKDVVKLVYASFAVWLSAQGEKKPASLLVVPSRKELNKIHLSLRCRQAVGLSCLPFDVT